MMQVEAEPRRFVKKSEWADAQAMDLQQRALQVLWASSDSTRSAARKFDAVRRLEDEASRFRSIAQALRRRGK
jgi:hypothetical protein